jgi:hypothetical protein
MIHNSALLLPPFRLWVKLSTLFQFIISLPNLRLRRLTSLLDLCLFRCEACAKQENKAEEFQTYVRATSGTRTHDPSVWYETVRKGWHTGHEKCNFCHCSIWPSSAYTGCFRIIPTNYWDVPQNESNTNVCIITCSDTLPLWLWPSACVRPTFDPHWSCIRPESPPVSTTLFGDATVIAEPVVP